MFRIKTILIAMLPFALASSISHAFCFEEAGQLYGINPGILWSIAKEESNFNPAAINYNGNGSYDFGLMQINSYWGKVWGPAAWDDINDPCTNVKRGAQILRDCIDRFGYSWEAIGCYNATSPDKRLRYSRIIYKTMVKYGLIAANRRG